MYRLEYPWLLALLPLPLLIYWLLPPYKEEQDSVRVTFFHFNVVGLGDPHATGENKVDYSALKQIAAATGGQVFHGENRVELDKAYATLDRITPQNFKTLSYRPRRELFMYPLGASAAHWLSHPYVDDQPVAAALLATA